MARIWEHERDIALYCIGNRASQGSVPRMLVRAELQGRGLHEEAEMTLLMLQQDTWSVTKTVRAPQDVSGSLVGRFYPNIFTISRSHKEAMTVLILLAIQKLTPRCH